MLGPQTEAAENLHAMKYRVPGETFRDSVNRVSKALCDDMPGGSHYHELREILGSQRFCPGGRIQAGAGATKDVTLFNCYMSDNIPDDMAGILRCFNESMWTMRMGGGIGYNFSTLRPKGELIRSLMSTTGGPLSFMPIFDAGCKAIASAGHRRGAQMGILNVDHPDIDQFINAKHDSPTLDVKALVR